MTPEDLLQSDVRLFSLPSIVMEFNMLVYYRAPFGEMSRLISQDAGLAARLLRIANSAHYALPRSIDNIPQAIAVVGVNDLSKMVLATMAVRKFAHIGQDLVDMEAFWRRSVLTGVAARILADESDPKKRDTVFVAGLLHDIGSLIFYHKEPEKSQLVLFEANGDRLRVPEIERGVFGFTFADMGAALAGHWNLPEVMEACIRQQLTPLSSEEHSLETRLIRISTLLDDLTLDSAGLAESQSMVECESLGQSPVTPDMLERLFAVLPQQASSMYGDLFHDV
ncbi:MAG: HDOD domain-containing protein [Pseudomonadota bacterium]